MTRLDRDEGGRCRWLWPLRALRSAVRHVQAGRCRRALRSDHRHHAPTGAAALAGERPCPSIHCHVGYHGESRSLQPTPCSCGKARYVIGHDLGHKEVRTYTGRPPRGRDRVRPGGGEFERPDDSMPGQCFRPTQKGVGDAPAARRPCVSTARGDVRRREIGEDAVFGDQAMVVSSRGSVREHRRVSIMAVRMGRARRGG